MTVGLDVLHLYLVGLPLILAQEFAGAAEFLRAVEIDEVKRSLQAAHHFHRFRAEAVDPVKSQIPAVTVVAANVVHRH